MIDRSNRVSDIMLRIVLALAGALVMVTGVNIAFGGIATLGLQGDPHFFTVINERAFLAQDSHVRFLGGLWLGIGLLFAIAALRRRALRLLRGQLCFAYLLVMLGGLARFTMMRADVVFGPDIIASLTAELLLMPLLMWWTLNVTRRR